MESRINVLIVEESQTFSMYLALLLQRFGFKSVCVSSPDAAKASLARDVVDVLILGDLDIPQSLCEIVRELMAVETGRSLPLIVISKHDDLQERRACLDAGCQAYLLKPLQPKHLHDALHEHTKTFPERRRHLRSKVDMVAEVSVNGDSPEYRKVLTLSRGGALVSCERNVSTGSKVAMILSMEDGDVPLVGNVLYNLANVDAHTPRAFGMMFHQVQDDKAEQIDAYLENLLTQTRLVSSVTGVGPRPPSTAGSS